eukprot:TRINITY_DN1806_c0_g1_i1.p1 TRINITY_DN1806_c0_g1~~TRINITY_DN1806_c0_g1_i1.p1  ORF type:complete len:372 (-),score=87.69 TRINITY_DN1806_c0_g1_i1:248-1297(-)
MGGCTSKSNNDPVSSKIEEQLKRDKEKAAHELKLLLLGAGESGKSTIAKQFKIINTGEYTVEELQEHRSFILDNIWSSVTNLCAAADELGIQVSQESRDTAKKLEPQRQVVCDVVVGMGPALAKFWADPGIQETVSKTTSSSVNENSKYFLDNIDRICAADWIPTQQDVIHCRIRTTGVIETTFPLGRYTTRLVDVGGQRAERRKWIGCFQEVTAVLFCVAISEYNLKLVEDKTTNRLQESMSIFKEVTSKWFMDTSVVLFLNKIDLFKDKLKVYPLSDYVPQYKGPDDFTPASKYIAEMFENLDTNKGAERLFVHFTCATDTNQVKVVFEAIKETLIKGALKDMGLMG